MQRFSLLMLCSLLVFRPMLRAEEPKGPPADGPAKDALVPTPKPPKPPKNPGKIPELDEPDDEDKVNRYKLPKNADSDDLVDFCQQLQDYEPEDDADAKIHEKKLPRAVKRACKRILELEDDKESDNARFARRMLLAIKLDTATDIDSPKTDKLLAKVQEFLRSPKVIVDDADVASALDDFLSAHVSPKSIDKSIEWSQKIGTDLSKLAIPELADVGKILLSTSKRLSLYGKPLELKGTTLKGKPFDLAQLKGKVVLVQFWASWCSHCVDEIPLIQKCYDDYHAKGFEVVAISADEDREALEEFIKSEHIPWTNLYEPGGKHPALDACGINAFPSSLLVDKEGIVTALDLRDTALTDELIKHFGEPAVDPLAKKVPPAPNAESKKEDAPEVIEDNADSIEKLKKKYSF